MHKIISGLFLPGLLALTLWGSVSLAVAGDRVIHPSAQRVDVTCSTTLSVDGTEQIWQKWQRGIASWYGQAFHNLRTASGERFDMNELTAAHPTLPFGTQLKVRNPANGRAVVVRVNDRGPFTGGRSLDLSRAAASALGLVQRGAGQVEMFLLQASSTLPGIPLLTALNDDCADRSLR